MDPEITIIRQLLPMANAMGVYADDNVKFTDSELKAIGDAQKLIAAAGRELADGFNATVIEDNGTTLDSVRYKLTLDDAPGVVVTGEYGGCGIPTLMSGQRVKVEAGVYEIAEVKKET